MSQISRTAGMRPTQQKYMTYNISFFSFLLFICFFVVRVGGGVDESYWEIVTITKSGPRMPKGSWEMLKVSTKGG